MENPKLEELLMQLVRDRDNLSPNDYATITNTDNVDAGINHLITLKRDVESQFIAMKTRLDDMYAQCEEAKRNDKTVAVEVDGIGYGGSRTRVITDLPPGEAYAKFKAKEGRWKVKNTRFLSLIEGAIADLKLSRNKTTTA